jgi:hypothetical protein
VIPKFRYRIRFKDVSSVELGSEQLLDTAPVTFVEWYGTGGLYCTYDHGSKYETIRSPLELIEYCERAGRAPY